MANNIDKLLRAIEGASTKFNGKLPAIEKKLLGEILLLIKEFSVKNGRIASNMDNLKLLNKIKGKLEKLVFSKEYVKDVSDFVRTYSTVASIQNDYFKGQDKSFKAKDYYSALKQVAIDNTIEGLTESGVRANVLKPINDILLTGITSGQSYAQMEETLRKTLTDTPDGAGALSRYAKTYTIDSINQFSREYLTAISNDLGYEWYAYRGSNLETTREFCEHMTKKEYVHKSEFPEILKGKIDGHQCRIYDKTGLPYGMKEGTNVDNFTANCGGWNCGHELIPLREESVPKSIRDKINTYKQTPIQSAYQKIESEEAKIRINNFETGYCVDKDGNILINKQGKATSVKFTDEEILRAKDGIFTHNHPTGLNRPENSIKRIGNSFSPADIRFAIKTNLSEIRAVTPLYTFTMKRPESGWPDLNAAVSQMIIIENNVRNVFYKMIRLSNNNTTVIERAEVLHFHLVWKEFSKRFGIEYSKRKI